MITNGSKLWPQKPAKHRQPAVKGYGICTGTANLHRTRTRRTCLQKTAVLPCYPYPCGSLALVTQHTCETGPHSQLTSQHILSRQSFPSRTVFLVLVQNSPAKLAWNLALQPVAIPESASHVIQSKRRVGIGRIYSSVQFLWTQQRDNIFVSINDRGAFLALAVVA